MFDDESIYQTLRSVSVSFLFLKQGKLDLFPFFFLQTYKGDGIERCYKMPDEKKKRETRNEKQKKGTKVKMY